MIKVQVQGYNFPRLLSYFLKRGIKLSRVKKDGENLSFCVSLGKKEEIVAILKDFGYNNFQVEKLTIGNFVANNLFLILGCVLFSLVLLSSNLFLFKSEVTCPDTVLKKEIEMAFLKEFGFVSLKNPKKLAEFEEKLKAHDDVAFYKQLVIYNTLYQEVVPKEKTTTPDHKEGIYAPFDGEVVGILTLSGTSLVKEGQKVKKGDLLIGGFREDKDKGKILPTKAEGKVSMLKGETFSDVLSFEKKEKFFEGEELTDTYFTLFGKDFFKKEMENVQTLEKTFQPFEILGLNFKVTKTTAKPYDLKTITKTEEELIFQFVEQTKENLSDAHKFLKIKKEEIFKERNENSLKISYNLIYEVVVS